MSGQDKLVLALDQGGHASRALVYDHEGSCLGQAEVAIATHTPAADRVEHDSEEMVDSVRRAATEALKQAAPGQWPLIAGLACQRSSIVCWQGDAGKPLSPVISWADRRAAALVQPPPLAAEEISQRTGLVANAHYGASKFRWCLDHLDSVQQARGEGDLRMGPLAGFLLQRLLRERPFVVDRINAARTLLMNLDDLAWDADLCHAFGVPETLLPRLHNDSHAFGTLELDGHRLPLRLCTGDQSAALFAHGAPAEDTLYINAGTGAFIQSRLPPYQTLAPAGLLTTLCHIDEKGPLYMAEGTVNGAGRALDWLAERLHCTLPELLALARETDTDAAIFLNGLGGLGSPFWRSDFPTAFVETKSRAAQALGVLQSIAFLLMENLRPMKTARHRRMLFSGGLSNIDMLCQWLADLSGLPVQRMEDHEATARGLCCLLGQSPPPAREEKRFIPGANPKLETDYRNWRQIMTQTLTQ